LMHWPWLPDWAEIKVPVPGWINPSESRPAPAPAVSSVNSVPLSGAETIAPEHFAAPPGSEPLFDARQADRAAYQSPDPAGKGAAQAESFGPRINHPARDRKLAGWLAIGSMLYLSIGAALLARLLMGLVSSLRIWSRATPVKGLVGAIGVRSSPNVTSPVNIGSGILLPADYGLWDEQKLRVVLAHERSHVEQRDFYLQLLAGLYAALIWFSPLGWWLKRKLSELGEVISDRAALNAASSASAYAGLLLEFAARPHPRLAGVAMAQTSHLTQRIERLLNEEGLERAFSGHRRWLWALAVAPVALVAATVVVRVQAAQVGSQTSPLLPSASALRPDPPAEQTSSQTPTQPTRTGQSDPAGAQVDDEGSPQAAPAPPPPQSPTAVPPFEPAPPAPVAAPAPAPATVDPLPGPVTVQPRPPVPSVPSIDVQVHLPPLLAEGRIAEIISRQVGENLSDLENGGGEAYAIVGDPGTRVRYYGDWDEVMKAEIDKARSSAHGHFLWFRHDGKSYIVDDPAIVSEIEAMEKPVDDLRDQMRNLGRQMRAAGEQQREIERKARQAATTFQPPDLSKEMADLNAAVSSLEAKQGMTREQLREIERKLAEVQRKLIDTEVKVDVNWSRDMSQFGQQQGQLGAKMGQMGADLGRLAREKDQKLRGIIEQSLKNGKARPVD
jgi:BlaR1 peptidase M56